MHSHTLAAALGGVLLLGPLSAAATPDAAALRYELDRANATVAAQVARAAYPEYFRRAYARYPNLPAGALEAIAYSETNWVHVRPQAQDPNDLHMPRSYGVMGLYHGGGFADQVGAGARLTGRTAQQVIDDPESNILAAAALLDRALGARPPVVPHDHRSQRPPHPGQRRSALHRDPRRSAAELPAAVDGAVELASARVPADRGRARMPVPVLRRALHLGRLTSPP